MTADGLARSGGDDWGKAALVTAIFALLLSIFPIGRLLAPDRDQTDMSQQAIDEAKGAQACCDTNTERMDRMYQKIMSIDDDDGNGNSESETSSEIRLRILEDLVDGIVAASMEKTEGGDLKMLILLKSNFIDFTSASFAARGREGAVADEHCNADVDFIATARGVAFMSMYYRLAEAMGGGMTMDDISQRGWRAITSFDDLDLSLSDEPTVAHAATFVDANRRELLEIAERHKDILAPLIENSMRIHSKYRSEFPRAAEALRDGGTRRNKRLAMAAIVSTCPSSYPRSE